jgi:hypothetical protein
MRNPWKSGNPRKSRYIRVRLCPSAGNFLFVLIESVCLDSRLSTLDSRLSTSTTTCHRYKHAEARASERSCCSLVEIAQCHARARSGQAPPCHTRNTNQTKPKTEKRPYRGETIAASKCNLRRQVCLPSSRGSRNRLTAISSFK